MQGAEAAEVEAGLLLRAAEQVALGGVAPEGLQPLELGRRLDALADAAQPEAARQLHDRSDEHLVAGRAAEALDEGAVDLHDVDRQAGEVAERRVAGAEVVDGEEHAEGPQLVQAVPDGLGVEEHRLGDLEHDPARVDAGAGEDAGDRGDRGGIEQLPGGQVHADLAAAARPAPARRPARAPTSPSGRWRRSPRRAP